MRVLLVASDRMEFAGILAHAAPSGTSEPRPAQVAVHWARAARVGSHDVLMVANGAGSGRAAAAVNAALAIFQPDALVSTGFCGALGCELGIADVVVATAVASDGREYPAAQPTATLPHHTGVICSIGHVAQTAREKAALRAPGCVAVEMEAAGVAREAAVRGLAFYCVRAVTDLAGEDLVNDFNEALREDGHFDR